MKRPYLVSITRNNRTTKISVFIILLAFCPGVFIESFWSDDYAALMNSNGMVQLLLSDARPTQAALTSLSFSLIDSPQNGWILRCFALVALILVFLFIVKRINKSRQGNIGIFAIAIAFCLPSFQMYIHWSNAWSFLWAALAGLHAFNFWTSSNPIKKLLGVFLLVLALTNYPPAAVFYFATIVVVNVLNGSKASKLINETIQGLYLFVIAAVTSITIVVITLQVFQVRPTGRVRLISLYEIPDKIVWLFTRPITTGLRPFMIDSPAPEFALITAMPIVFILFFGIKVQARLLNESIFRRGFYVAFSLILTLIPLVVTPENQIEFRLISGYCWGITSLAVYFFLIMVDQRFGNPDSMTGVKTTILFTTPIALLLVSVISVNVHYMELFNNSYHKKNAFLNEKISTCFNTGGARNVFILPPKQPFPFHKRLGVFSMSTDLYSGWVAEPNVELILKQRGVSAHVKYFDKRPTNLEERGLDCIIDLEEFRKTLIKIPTKDSEN